jgi:hypothetical protein
MCFLDYNLDPPQSFLDWYDAQIKELEENDGEFCPENKFFNNVSEVYEYYAKCIPENIWREFSLYLARVIDSYLEDNNSFQGLVF